MKAKKFSEKEITAQAIPDDATLEKADEIAESSSPLLFNLFNAESTE